MEHWWLWSPRDDGVLADLVETNDDIEVPVVPPPGDGPLVGLDAGQQAAIVELGLVECIGTHLSVLNGGCECFPGLTDRHMCGRLGG